MFTRLVAICSSLSTVGEFKFSKDHFPNILLDKPEGEYSELYFRKLVQWIYSFKNESGYLVTFILDFLRSADPGVSKKARDLFAIVQAFRTKFSHNLSEAELFKANHQTQVWTHNFKSDTAWDEMCNELLRDAIETIEEISSAWLDKVDLSIFETFKEERDKHIPNHELDTIIAECCAAQNIEGLDIPKFRKDNSENWKKKAQYFSTASTAKVAITGLIDTQISEFVANNTN